MCGLSREGECAAAGQPGVDARALMAALSERLRVRSFMLDAVTNLKVGSAECGHVAFDFETVCVRG